MCFLDETVFEAEKGDTSHGGQPLILVVLAPFGDYHYFLYYNYHSKVLILCQALFFQVYQLIQSSQLPPEFGIIILPNKWEALKSQSY